MLQHLKLAATACTRGLLSLLGPAITRRAVNLLAAALQGRTGGPGVLREERVRITTPRGALNLYCLGDLAMWRAETLLTKEPETIAWIDGMKPDEVLWDIGANVGLYTVYAGAVGGLRVLAFEPAAANYFLLNRNVEANGLSSRVTAYCLALNDATHAGELLMQGTELGGAMNSFDDPVDNFGQRFEASFRQGTIGFSIDDFIARFDPPFPDHIKIDVDGIENRIITGAARTLADPRLKSLSVELDSARPEYTQPVISDIEAGGLVLAAKRRSEMFDGTEFETIFNYQFRRP